MELKIIIKDPIGLHARPASILVQEASKFESDFSLFSNGREANLKSIMSVMALGVKTGDEVVIVATGVDADEAIRAIEISAKTSGLA